VALALHASRKNRERYPQIPLTIVNNIKEIINGSIN